MNDETTGPARPVARYGRPRRRRTWLVLLAYGIGIAVAAGLLGWVAFVQLASPASWEVRTFTVLSDEEIEVTFEVRRDDGQAVECLLAAQAGDHSVVGEMVLTVPEGPQTVRVTQTLQTQAMAVVATVESCDPVD